MKYIKVYFDSRFTGLHKNSTLISIGFISEYGDTFYAEFVDYDTDQLSEWLRKNVLSNLILNPFMCSDFTREIVEDRMLHKFRICSTASMISHALADWCYAIIGDSLDELEMWGDCLSYDWVFLNDLFGQASQLPKSIHYIPFDLCTLFKVNGIDPAINRETFASINKKTAKKFNSLWDAKVIKVCVEKLLGKNNGAE